MIVVASVRQGRAGLPISKWVEKLTSEHGAFEIDFVDLAELSLPFMDEPNHPRLQQYEHEHTKAWSKRVAAADAFIFVMPEYNHGFSAPLKNALDYLVAEWSHKPLGLVSYGGLSAGVRAITTMEPVLIALKFLTSPATAAALAMPFGKIADGEFAGDDTSAGFVKGMLDELQRLMPVSQTLRTA